MEPGTSVIGGPLAHLNLGALPFIGESGADRVAFITLFCGNEPRY